MKPRSGQILVLVLLIVVVSLAIGLSVASRNITNLRTTTQTEQSQRAFSTAEGGIEHALSDLPSFVDKGDVGVSVGDLTANVNVKSSKTYRQSIEDGSVGQIDLAGYGGSITVDWILKADTLVENVSTKPPLEITFICQNAGSCFSGGGSIPAGCSFLSTPGSSYSQLRCGYEPEDKAGQEGFVNCTLSVDPEFLCRATFTSVSVDNVRFMRVRPFWKKATVKVFGDASFPNQTYEVTSTATTDLGITRRVLVERTSLPQLPSVFDFVLFSETQIVK